MIFAAAAMGGAIAAILFWQSTRLQASLDRAHSRELVARVAADDEWSQLLRRVAVEGQTTLHVAHLAAAAEREQLVRLIVSSRSTGEYRAALATAKTEGGDLADADRHRSDILAGRTVRPEAVYVQDGEPIIPHGMG